MTFPSSSPIPTCSKTSMMASAVRIGRDSGGSDGYDSASTDGDQLPSLPGRARGATCECDGRGSGSAGAAQQREAPLHHVIGTRFRDRVATLSHGGEA